MAADARRLYNNPPDQWSANEAYLKDGNPGSVSNPNNALGSHNEDLEQMRSEGRGPDPYYNNPPDQLSTNEAYLKDDPGCAKGRVAGNC